MKFERTVTPTIMSGRVVRWTEQISRPNALEISASRDGVMIQGYSNAIGNLEDLIVLRKAIEEAWAEFELMHKGRTAISPFTDYR